MYELGHAYETGDQVKQDIHEAEIWYQRATDGGSIHASYYLGLLRRSSGDYQRAIELFRIGARAEFAPSLNNLAIMYFNGQGVKQDKKLARELWERAANMGHIFSIRNLAHRLIAGVYGMSGVPKGMLMLVVAIISVPFIVAADKKSEKIL